MRIYDDTESTPAVTTYASRRRRNAQDTTAAMPPPSTARRTRAAANATQSSNTTVQSTAGPPADPVDDVPVSTARPKRGRKPANPPATRSKRTVTTDVCLCVPLDRCIHYMFLLSIIRNGS